MGMGTESTLGLMLVSGVSDCFGLSLGLCNDQTHIRADVNESDQRFRGLDQVLLPKSWLNFCPYLFISTLPTQHTTK